MFRLYTTAKVFGQRPSEIIGIPNDWWAYQLDAAVSLVGIVIENASQEMQEVSGLDGKKTFQPKYTMDMLLDPDFRLPRPATAKDREKEALGMLRALAGRKGSGVKVFKAKAAE